MSRRMKIAAMARSPATLSAADSSFFSFGAAIAENHCSILRDNLWICFSSEIVRLSASDQTRSSPRSCAAVALNDPRCLVSFPGMAYGLAVDLPVSNQYWVAASSVSRNIPWSGVLTCVDGKKTWQPAPRPSSGKLWARSTNPLLDCSPLTRYYSMQNPPVCKVWGLHVADLAYRPHAWSSLCSYRSDLTDTGEAETQIEDKHQVTKTCFQIFIKTPESKSFLAWIDAESTVMQLKQQIYVLTGYPRQIQHLVNGRWSLQDNRTMGSYGIKSGETIVMNLRLRGGAPPQGQTSSSGGEMGKKTATQQQPKGGNTYKNILQGKKDPGSSPDQGKYTPRPYIVDQLGQTPALNLDSTGLDGYVKSYETQALICRFNSFWPKPSDLFHWIFTTWTMECDIHLCSKGFFIVRFASTEVRETIISNGPWFWGTAGLFMTPWFPDFDPNTMTVTKVPVWVRLFNLPLHFWSEQVLEGIGNSIGKYIKTDLERIDERLYTFARICVEVDLSKGLPDNIRLIYKQQNWMQTLDYENTAFRCRVCRQTGHLQNTCPEAKKVNSKKKQKGKQRKGWQFPPPDSDDEESEAEEEDILAENAEVPKEKENKEEATTENKDTNSHQKQAEKTNEEQNMGGNKRHHHSDTSDSDKETGSRNAETQLVIASIEPAQGGWRKVEKKKGRKS